jgi:GAF domain-containing protein
MALPLKVGDRIIGALDVQSQYPNAFSEDDIAIMQVLTDQLAIAIANARLIQESQENLRQLQILFGSYSQKAWKELAETSLTLGYQYDQRGVRPITKIPADGNQSIEPASRAPIHVPIQVRGQVVANLEAWPKQEDFDPEARSLLKAIADRLGQTIENARLFHEAQQRAEMERLVGQVTSRMRETMDVETIVQTAAKEFRKILNLAEAEVRLGDAPVNQPSGNGSHEDPK